jgi:hypothetical protein
MKGKESKSHLFFFENSNDILSHIDKHHVIPELLKRLINRQSASY